MIFSPNALRTFSIRLINQCIDNMFLEERDKYLKTCLKAWLMCESCSQSEMNSVVPRYELIVECNACAEACFDLVLGLLSNADDIGDFPFRCIVHCRQCIEECRK